MIPERYQFLLKNWIPDTKVTILNKIFNSFFRKLMSNTKYSKDLYWQAIPQLLIDILSQIVPLKEKPITEFSVLISL